MRRSIILSLTVLLAFAANAQKNDFYKKLGSNCPNIPLELFFDRNNDLHSISFENDTIFIHKYDSAKGNWIQSRITPSPGFSDLYNKPEFYSQYKKIIPFYLKSTLYLALSNSVFNEYTILKESGPDTFTTVLQPRIGYINDVAVYNDTAYLGGSSLIAGAHLGKFGGAIIEPLNYANMGIIKDVELVNDTLFAIDNNTCYQHDMIKNNTSIYYVFTISERLEVLSVYNGKVYIASSNTTFPVYELNNRQIIDTIFSSTILQYPTNTKQQFTQHKGKLYQTYRFIGPDNILKNYGISVLDNTEFKSLVPPNHFEQTDSFTDFSGVLFSNKNQLFYVPRIRMETNGDTINIASINPDSINYFTNDTIYLQSFLDNDTNGILTSGDSNLNGFYRFDDTKNNGIVFDNSALQPLFIPNFMTVTAIGSTVDNCVTLPFTGSLTSDNLSIGKSKDTLIFPFITLTSSTNVKGQIFLTSRARLNDTVTYRFNLVEQGCPPTTPRMYAKIILAKNTNYISSNPPIAKKIGDTLFYTVNSVNKFNPFIGEFMASFSNTAFKIGDSVIQFYEVYSDSTYSTILSKDLIKTLMVYSYDPNIKVCEPSGVVTKDFDKIKYTIHFENEGNDEARTVIVSDTIDTRLPALYFRMIGASHPFSVGIKNNIVTWTFNNINLKGKSEDPSASKGWVAFEVKINTPIAIGDSVRNKASIYFDLNEPIITNNAVIRRKDLIDNVAQVHKLGDQILIYPNPADEKVTIDNLLTENLNLTLYDIQGRLIKNIALTKSEFKEISIAELPQGLYFIKVLGTGQSYKLMIE